MPDRNLDHDYLQAMAALRARSGAAHTLSAQLAQIRTIHAVERALLQKRQSQDQDDIVTAFEADKEWDAGV